MATMGFDFSAYQPYMQQMLGYANQAAQYRLGQMPREGEMRDRAFQEWLSNQESTRNLGALNFQEGAYGREAANALSAYGINSQNVELANQRNASIGNTAYGGESAGGVEGAKLSSFAMPPPYIPPTPPSYGPRTSVNVAGGGGGYSSPGGGGGGGGYSYGGGGGGGGGSTWLTPEYWNTETSGGYSQDEADAQTTYGPWRRRK